MAPPSWATAAQLEWLHGRIGKYMESKQTGDQIDFFVKIDEEWFKLWPEEAACGLPSRASKQALTPEQSAVLAEALTRRKGQLRTWYRNNTNMSRKSGAAGVKTATKNEATLMEGMWQTKKRTRAPQLIELYQVRYKTRVKAALTAEGFDKIGADDDWVAHENEEAPEMLKGVLKQQRGERMAMRRAVSTRLFEAETEEVKKEIEEELRNIKAARSQGKEQGPLTPAMAQKSLDQVEAVTQRFHAMLFEKTGWVGVSLFGGPMPNQGGQLATTAICSGRTPAGNSFKDSHPDWKGGVSKQFGEWLKRFYTRAERDSMALPDPDDFMDDLLPLSDVEDDPIDLPPTTAPSVEKGKFKAPKRPKKTKTKTKTKSPPTATTDRTMLSVDASPSSQPFSTPPLATSSSSPDRGEYGNTAPNTPHEGMDIPITTAADDWGMDNTWDTQRNLLDTSGLGNDERVGHDVGFGIDGAHELDSFLRRIGELEAGTGAPDDAQKNETLDRELYTDIGNAHMDGPPRLAEGGTILRAIAPRPCFTNAQFPVNREIGAEMWGKPYVYNSFGINGDSAISAPTNWGSAQRPTANYIPVVPIPAGGRPPSPPPHPSHPSPPHPPPVRPPVTPNKSPLPPRIARSSSSAGAIAASSAALAAAMSLGKKQGEGSEAEGSDDNSEERSDSSDEDEDIPLAGPSYYPESRPMANPPKPMKKKTTTAGGLGSRGRGGRGVRGARGRGGRGGGAVGRRATASENTGDALDEAEGPVEIPSTMKRPVGRPRKAATELPADLESGRVQKRGRQPLRFLQTYGDQGEIIPLPLDTELPVLSAAEKRSLRARQKILDAAPKGKAPKPPHRLHNPDGNTDLVILPRQSGAPMPPVPELGRPGRSRRPPKNPNDDAELLEAMVNKRKAEGVLEKGRAKNMPDKNERKRRELMFEGGVVKSLERS
ncbi:hypothetical protein C8R43DRAFT_951752 [Mycena crocata]|nr:hypothetical protein C8R43DRAFT_951752 [Mycena crocata]